jgi:predicted ArsR family transcriptional regulator
MKSTRLQILDLLQNQAGMTARELSQALLVSTADVRYHLGALRREGLIEPVRGSYQPQDRTEGNRKRSAGRPAERYCLSVRARPDRYDRLAEALLEEILAGALPHERKALLDRIAARMGGDGKPVGSLASRLVQAVQRLNELQYEASWEARPGHPQVKLGICPYASILPGHPELCQLDAQLLENLLGAPVLQTARQVPDIRGARFCLFLVGKPKSL